MGCVGIQLQERAAPGEWIDIDGPEARQKRPPVRVELSVIELIISGGLAHKMPGRL